MNTWRQLQTAAIFSLIMVASAGQYALAQDAELSADDAAKKLANPAGSLANLANNFTYTSFKGDLPGADSQDAWSYVFQPVLPFPVGDKGHNVTFRPAFKVTFDQPVFDSEAGAFRDTGTELNDLTYDLVYAGTNLKGEGNGTLWGFGIAGTIPLASENALGGDQWRIGPEFFGGIIRKWGLAGALVNHTWNLGGGDGGPGSNDEPFSVTAIQYFYGITLGGGWQILSGPVITYDWQADKSGDALTLPLGVGIAKTGKIGKTTWRGQIEVQYFVKQPDSFGTDWLMTIDIRPVIQNPLIGLFGGD